jgi:hypothetical protein
MLSLIGSKRLVRVHSSQDATWMSYKPYLVSKSPVSNACEIALCLRSKNRGLHSLTFHASCPTVRSGLTKTLRVEAVRNQMIATLLSDDELIAYVLVVLLKNGVYTVGKQYRSLRSRNSIPPSSLKILKFRCRYDK